MSEESSARYVMDKGLLPHVDVCNKCKGKVILTTRKQRGNITAVWRCQQRECSAMRSVRNGCIFVTKTDRKGKTCTSTSLAKIVEILFLWSMEMSVTDVMKYSGVSSPTLISWFKSFRRIRLTI